MTEHAVFLDGSSGTTGLELANRLAGHKAVRLLIPTADERRSESARKRLLERAEVAILCLPDDAARKTAALASDLSVRLLDASTAHRTTRDWIYGFPEMEPKARDLIRTSRRVSNPGCYATGSISLLRPLTHAGLVSPDWTPVFHGVSGYSGGGRDLIAAFESDDDTAMPHAHYAYSLGLNHKHLPEIRRFGGHNRALLLPSVGSFRRGMLLSLAVPPEAWTTAPPSRAHITELLQTAYADEPFIEVAAPCADDTLQALRLSPEAMNFTNRLQLRVFTSDETGEGSGTLLLTACLDNLGKGASGAAVQNLNIMLGLPEDTSLSYTP